MAAPLFDAVRDELSAATRRQTTIYSKKDVLKHVLFVAPFFTVTNPVTPISASHICF